MSPGTITGCPGNARRRALAVHQQRAGGRRRPRAPPPWRCCARRRRRTPGRDRAARAEDPLERLARRVGEHLAVGEGEVGGGPHGRRGSRSPRGARPARRRAGDRARSMPYAQRRAGERQVVGAHLMAEPARAGVDHDRDLPAEARTRSPPRSSWISSTTCTSRKWLPEPSVPSWSQPALRRAR